MDAAGWSRISFGILIALKMQTRPMAQQFLEKCKLAL